MAYCGVPPIDLIARHLARETQVDRLLHRCGSNTVTVVKLKLARSKETRFSRRIDQLTVNRWAPTVNQAVVSCAQASVWQPALLAVAGALRQNLFRPKIETYNAMATACLRCHIWSWGLLLLGSAQQKGLRLDAVSAASAFASCQTEQQWKVTGKILQHLRVGEDGGVPCDLHVTSAAMTSLEKGDQWQEAIELFIASQVARLSQNVVSCSAAITACEAGRWWPGAFDLLQQMRQKALRPNAFSHQAALSSTVDTWRQGLKRFESMRREGGQGAQGQLWCEMDGSRLPRPHPRMLPSWPTGRGEEAPAAGEAKEGLGHRSSAEEAAMAISNKKLQKIMTLPINQIFRYLQNRSRVQAECIVVRSGCTSKLISGLRDESWALTSALGDWVVLGYMNLVIDDAEEVLVKKKTRRAIGHWEIARWRENLVRTPGEAPKPETDLELGALSSGWAVGRGKDRWKTLLQIVRF
ncbi:unnamed protein product [Cladocopium goreaui]|uniref:Probable small nuclear ribonucleoprotein E (SnRNP-E) (Sm protein E) (Sm-E) (SmE) n=1 Tax=Cladocopium goreaui TaxID=2562237 RepID=A0A9P1DXJ7_9DINO|nr:unnamed protein product [Cladocopium goreaui]